MFLRNGNLILLPALPNRNLRGLQHVQIDIRHRHATAQRIAHYHTQRLTPIANELGGEIAVTNARDVGGWVGTGHEEDVYSISTSSLQLFRHVTTL